MRYIDTDHLLDRCVCGARAVFVAARSGTMVECLDNCGESIPPVQTCHESVIEWNKHIRKRKKIIK